MNEWIEIKTGEIDGLNSEYIISPMPRDGALVMVCLEAGDEHSAIFEFYGPEEWWFAPVDADGNQTDLPEF